MEKSTNGTHFRLVSAVVFVAIIVLLLSGGSFYLHTLADADAAIVDVAGRNRMLSQRMGYFAERIARGDEGARQTLAEIIDLHNRSIKVLKDGGVAPDVTFYAEIPPAEEEVLDHILSAETLWLEYMGHGQTILQEPTFIDGELNPAVRSSLIAIEETSPEMLIRNNAIVASSVEVYHARQGLVETAEIVGTAVALVLLIWLGAVINSIYNTLERERRNLEVSLRELMQTKAQEESSRKEAEESSKKYKEVSDALIGRELKMAEMKKDIESLKDKEE